MESFDWHWRWHWKVGKIQKTGEGISEKREQSGKNEYGWQKFKGSGTGRASLSKIAATSHLMQRVDSLYKTLMLGGIGGRRTEDEMAGWHHWLDGQESEWTPGVGDGQGGLVCCDSWGRKELDKTERLNWTELSHLWLLSSELFTSPNKNVLYV